MRHPRSTAPALLAVSTVFICLALVASLTTALFMYIYKLSRTYGDHGLMKKVARKGIPKVVKNYSSILLKKQLLHEKLV